MSEKLLRTPLFDAHKAAGGRMVPFGGWEMPVQYSGIVDEHRTVREAVGLFDVSHMGQVILRGAGALASVQRIITNDASQLVSGQALYTVMCLPSGGIVDDCIVYRRGDDDFLIVVNASNIAKDENWIRENATGCDITNESDATALIAVQGPKAVGLVESMSGQSGIKPFHYGDVQMAGVPVMAARTGYTGEDGFELACPADQARTLWDALLDKGKDLGIKPAGLGARDTLRLEARLSLYGNDIDETTTPLEAGLGWVVKMAKEDFIGKDALAKQKADGIPRKLVGMVMQGRGIARHDYAIVDGADSTNEIGKITSGTKGPTVDKAIALGYVPTQLSKPGTTLHVNCRGKIVEAEVVKGPFYKRPS